jgi:hypothetical protein
MPQLYHHLQVVQVIVHTLLSGRARVHEDPAAGRQEFDQRRHEHGENQAERIIAEELNRLGWTQADLAIQRKRAPGRLDLAARLRRGPIMPLKWIAARVHLGTSKSANGKLHEWMKQPKTQRADAAGRETQQERKEQHA